MGVIIGIDLGTTNSAMAVVEDGEPKILENAEGERTTPSVVRIEEDEVVVGSPAERAKLANTENTITRVKQHMDDQDYTVGPINGEEYTPPQVSSRILEKLKKDAEDRLEEEVEGAVVTVPAYFGNYAREATKDAGEMVDLSVERVLNEPTAACLKYGFEKETEETILVYDLGGGTFDATLVEMKMGEKTDSVKVRGTDGDRQLGGEEIDDIVYEHLREEMIEQGFTDPEEEEEKILKTEIRRAAKQAKEDLSSQQSVEIIQRMEGEIFEAELTRKEFNEMTEEFVDRTFELVDELFEHEDVTQTPDDVDTVLLAGGSTRIPLIHERIEEYFGIEPSLGENPDEVVAEGAAIQAANMVDLVEGAEEDEKRTLEGDVVTRDVISHSLGVELSDGSFDPVIGKNSEIPHREKKEPYTTVRDNQTSIRVKIYEGEEPTAEDNRYLGEFTLDGVPPQPAGEPKFRIIFEVDENGILTAEVEDMEGDLSESITLDDSIGLSDEEIEKGKEAMPQYSGSD